jgi:5-methylcytosine-specific restriction endonuclease McrA
MAQRTTRRAGKQAGHGRQTSSLPPVDAVLAAHPDARLTERRDRAIRKGHDANIRDPPDMGNERTTPEQIALRLSVGCRSRRRRNTRWRFWRAAPFCWYCGRFLFWVDTTIDHLTPRAKRGGEGDANLKLCCRPCNEAKANLSVESIVCSVQRGRVLVRMSEFLTTEVNMMKTTIVGFNYELVKSRDRKATETHAAEIRGLLACSTANIIDIGRHVKAVHDKLGSTLFLSWVRAEFQWSQAQAYNYMRAAGKFGNVKNIDQFQPSAVIELCRKDVDRRAIIAAVKQAANGELVTRRAALALIAKYDAPKPAESVAASGTATQESSAGPGPVQTDAPATGASGGRPSPHSATPAVAIDAAGQWRSGVEVLRKLCEQPLKMPRNDIELLADQLLELALHLRTMSRNAPGERIDTSVPAADRGKRRSAVRPRKKAVA